MNHRKYKSTLSKLSKPSPFFAAVEFRSGKQHHTTRDARISSRLKQQTIRNHGNSYNHPTNRSSCCSSSSDFRHSNGWNRTDLHQPTAINYNEEEEVTTAVRKFPNVQQGTQFRIPSILFSSFRSVRSKLDSSLLGFVLLTPTSRHTLTLTRTQT